VGELACWQMPAHMNTAYQYCSFKNSLPHVTFEVNTAGEK